MLVTIPAENIVSTIIQGTAVKLADSGERSNNNNNYYYVVVRWKAEKPINRPSEAVKDARWRMSAVKKVSRVVSASGKLQ